MFKKKRNYKILTKKRVKKKYNKTKHVKKIKKINNKRYNVNRNSKRNIRKKYKTRKQKRIKSDKSLKVKNNYSGGVLGRMARAARQPGRAWTIAADTFRDTAKEQAGDLLLQEKRDGKNIIKTVNNFFDYQRKHTGSLESGLGYAINETDAEHGYYR